MAPASSREITELLVSWNAGDQSALDELVPLVQAELHRLARHYMMGERQGHVLQTTALINEAYMRLIDWKKVSWQNRCHFFGVAARLMRHILVDFARQRPRLSPDTEVQQVSLEEAGQISNGQISELAVLDEALNSLAAQDPRKCQIVELRFFGGLTVEETAEVLKLSPITVHREWDRARAWLYRELSK